MSIPSLKLHYFELPGRGEAIRLILKYANIPFEDVTFSFQQWPELKSKFPFGQVPVLEVDGKFLAQQGAIERYVAKLAGLTPEDPLQQARIDEVLFFYQEVMDVLAPSYKIQDKEAKIAARKELLAGAMGTKLAKLQELLAAHGGPFFLGDKPSLADFSIYSSLSFLVSGFYDGIDASMFDSYPGLKAHHNAVAQLPFVKALYDGVTEGSRLTYKAL